MSSDAPGSSNAFVTLLTSDSYLPGALVLAESLRITHGRSRKGKRRVDEPPYAAGSSFQLVALITPETLSIQSIRALRRSGLFDWIVGVEPIGFRQILAHTTTSDANPPSGTTSVLAAELDKKVLQMERNLGLLGRPDLVNTLTKLQVWRLGRDSKDLIGHLAASPLATATWQGFDKVVFLDADTLVLRRIDHLFRLSDDPRFAAAPDTGWPDAFNSGVMLLKPSVSTFESMREFARSTGSWDGADQGLLNDFFGNEQGMDDDTTSEAAAPGGGWKRLSFRYNVTSHGGYTFVPAYQRYGSSINVVHFIGQSKPWNMPRPNGYAVPNPLAEPTNLGSQIITPDQSDYLISLWHSAFTSLYPSSASASPGEDFTIVHTDRGVEVIEKQAFSVPTYHAVWDVVAQEERDSESGADSTGNKEATYVSLPLDGRISLVAPVPRVPSPIPPPRRASPVPIPGSHEQTPQHYDGESSEQYSPPKLTWNPAREPPPKGTDPSSYQMRVPIDTFYSNKWDEASRNPRSLAEQKAAFFVPVPVKKHEHGGPGYIPPKLLRDNVFGNLGNNQPDPSKVKAVFPWEAKSDTALAAGRVFPDDPRPPAPSVTKSTQATSAASGLSDTRPGPSTSRRGLPNNLAYVNAWDQQGAIGNFANAWSRRTQPVSPARARFAQQSSHNSPAGASEQSRKLSPNISAVSQSSGRRASLEGQGQLSGDEASDSRDGDDESSSGGDESGDEQTPSRGLQAGGEFSSRPVPRPREGPGKGYLRKAEMTALAQGSSASRSPRTGSRPLSYASPTGESASGGAGEGRSGARFSSSSSTSNTTVTGDGVTGRQRARDRIRPDGWVSPSGNFNSPPKHAGYNSATASLRGIPGAGASWSAGSGGHAGGGANIHRAIFPGSAPYSGRRREIGSSNESQSASGGSGANSPTALLSPSLGHIPSAATSMFYQPSISPTPMPGTFPARTMTPPGSDARATPPSANMEEPFSSSPLNTRSELSQQARVHRQANPSASNSRR